MNDRSRREDHDALDLRIEEVLRRRYALPSTLDDLARRARPRRAAGPWPWVVFAAAAALLAAFFALRPQPNTPEVQRVARAPRLDADAPFCRMIGPLVDGEPAPGARLEPDLVRLYRDMDACQREKSSAAPCSDGDELAARLSGIYGQPLDVRPEAAGLLHGPFGSDEWPTGTIVTGPASGLTSVLVAERDATLACCLEMNLPDDSGLHLFTWQVGEVVLTEISPLAEPQLLGYFQ